MLRDLLLGPRARRHWMALFVALSAATLVVALLPAERAPDSTGWDKLDHALAFGALGVVGVFALRWMRRGVVLLVPLLAALGAAIELLQAFVPSRRADAADFVADVVGAVLGTLLAWLVARALEGPVRDEPGHPPR
jgi:VanZ family protein